VSIQGVTDIGNIPVVPINEDCLTGVGIHLGQRRHNLTIAIIFLDSLAVY